MIKRGSDIKKNCRAIDEDQMTDYGQKYARRSVLRQSKVTDVLWRVAGKLAEYLLLVTRLANVWSGK